MREFIDSSRSIRATTYGTMTSACSRDSNPGSLIVWMFGAAMAFRTSWLLFRAAFVSASILSADPVPNRPKLVFILADDLGWGDLSCHGHAEILTPNAG